MFYDIILCGVTPKHVRMWKPCGLLNVGSNILYLSLKHVKERKWHLRNYSEIFILFEIIVGGTLKLDLDVLTAFSVLVEC